MDAYKPAWFNLNFLNPRLYLWVWNDSSPRFRIKLSSLLNKISTEITIPPELHSNAHGTRPRLHPPPILPCRPDWSPAGAERIHHRFPHIVLPVRADHQGNPCWIIPTDAEFMKNYADSSWIHADWCWIHADLCRIPAESCRLMLNSCWIMLFVA